MDLDEKYASRSAGFIKSQLIWIYIIFTRRFRVLKKISHNGIIQLNTEFKILADFRRLFWTSLIWPRGYKTLFMLNSTKHESSAAHKNLNTEKERYF